LSIEKAFDMTHPFQTASDVRKDVWLTADQAADRLLKAGYSVTVYIRTIAFGKNGHIGSLSIHPFGVDESKIKRLERS
jgi:hypothetical protein